MRKLITLLLILYIGNPYSGQAQNTCGNALQQLQSYANQVNNIYNQEYYQIIPNQRCPAYNAWGQPYNPVEVNNCRYQWLSSLNYWYSQQCAFVNSKYGQIASSCSDNSGTASRSRSRPAPKVDTDSEEASEDIDVEEIEELEIGDNEDKLVRITIPGTAKGFRTSNR